MSALTLERWALRLIQSESLSVKFDPGPPPSEQNHEDAMAAPSRPGRPPELHVVERAPKSPSAGALVAKEARARLLHTFLHHELQAAELMAWAILAFPETPEAFRRGLASIACDEVRHMRMYRAHLRTLGFEFGDFPVRDWFWQRVPTCTTPLAFVALMGLGFEGGNLEHATRFAELFRQVGDDKGARIQEQVAAEEIAHVRFASHWFKEWSDGELRFTDWLKVLPAPLSPMVMRGKPLAIEARLEAGLSPAFVQELGAWVPSGS